MEIEIKGKTFNGTVTIYDRLTLPQVEAIEEALFNEPPQQDGKVRLTHVDKPRIPALLACVEKWSLENFPESPTVENFPMTPRRESHNMVSKIFFEITKVYNGEIDIPNG